MKQPNVIVCLCDQMRACSVGVYGARDVQTPNIDRMASRGVWFRAGCSNSPLCVPARSVLLTGQYARTCTGTSSNYVGFPPCGERVRCVDATLPEVFRDAGYHTALIGKWHVHPAPHLVGFDTALYPHNLHQHYGQSFFDGRGNSTRVDGFSPEYEMARVRDFLRERGQRPFFLLYSISPPHCPVMDAPRTYTAMYSRDDVTLRDNVWTDGRATHDRDWFRMYMWDYRGNLLLHQKKPYVGMPDDYDTRRKLGPYLGVKELVQRIQELADDPAAGEAIRRQFPYLVDESMPPDFDLRDLTALYNGMVTCVDDRLGELMQALDAEGLAEDTLVVFTSDHGDNLGSHGLWMKDHLYEESIMIPMIYQWPGALHERCVSTQVGGLVDMAPTILSLAGLPIPGTAQGTDLSSVLRGETASRGENAAFIETYRHRAIGIRTPTHLYGIPMRGEDESRWQPVSDIGAHLFFDVEADPCELNNLVRSQGGTPLAESLRQRLLKWHAETPRLKPRAATGKSQEVAIY